MRLALLGGFFVACSTFTLLASAAEPFVAASGLDGAGLGKKEAPNGRAWIDVATYVNFDEGLGTTPIIGGGVSLIEEVEIEAAVPTLAFFDDVDSEFALGNPYLGANFVHLGNDLRFRGGVRLALPVTNPDTLRDYLLPVAGMGVRGGQAAYLWLPEMVSVIPNLRLEFDASDSVVLTLDSALSVLFPTEDWQEGGAEAVLDVAPGIAVRVANPVTVGIRAPTMLFLTSDDNDDDFAQVSLEPYVRGDFGAGFVSARFQYMVDEPYGPSFDDRVWNVGIAGGIAF